MKADDVALLLAYRSWAALHPVQGSSCQELGLWGRAVVEEGAWGSHRSFNDTEVLCIRAPRDLCRGELNIDLACGIVLCSLSSPNWPS